MRLKKHKIHSSITTQTERVFHLILWTLVVGIEAQNVCRNGVCVTPCDFKANLYLSGAKSTVDVVNPLLETCYQAYALDVKKAHYQRLISCSSAGTASELCLKAENDYISQYSYFDQFKKIEGAPEFCWGNYQSCSAKYISDFEIY